MINEIKNLFFEDINKIGKTLGRLSMKNKQKTRVPKVKTEIKGITTVLTKMKTIKKEHFE